MIASILVDQRSKFDGHTDVKVNLYEIFSNEKEIANVPKRELQLAEQLYSWYYIGTLRKEQLNELPFLDLSICERYEMIHIENEDQIKQVKQLL